jgi:hypothetical protein
MAERTGIHERAVRALEEHGYLFQQRCLADIKTLASDYHFESEEYPVSIGQENTVIDFIFSAGSRPTFLILECKRANPDYVTWLFSRPMASPDERPKFLATRLDLNDQHPNAVWLETAEIDLLSTGASVTVGLELSGRETRQSKASRSSTSKAIFDACQQALTGVGGLALEHKKSVAKQGYYRRYHYVPIVVTTANLVLTEFRLSGIDIKTGGLSLEKAQTKSVDWVVFDFPVREGLQVTVPDQDLSYISCGPSEEHRRRFKVKSVAIVKGVDIVPFLKQLRIPT